MARSVRPGCDRLGALQGVRASVSTQRVVVNPCHRGDRRDHWSARSRGHGEAIDHAASAAGLAGDLARRPGPAAPALRPGRGRWTRSWLAPGWRLAHDLELTVGGAAGVRRRAPPTTVGAPERLFDATSVPGGVDLTLPRAYLASSGSSCRGNFRCRSRSWGFRAGAGGGQYRGAQAGDSAADGHPHRRACVEAGIPNPPGLPGRGSLSRRFVTHPAIGKVCFTARRRSAWRGKIMAGCAAAGEVTSHA